MSTPLSAFARALWIWISTALPFLVAAASVLAPAARARSAADVSREAEPGARGDAAFRAGRFEEAAREWSAAASAATAAGDSAGRARASLKLAAAYQSLGQYRLAEETLLAAEPAITASGDHAALIALEEAFGTLFTLTRDLERAEAHLAKALARAREDGAARAVAVVLNGLGNLHAAENENEAAVASYEDAAAAARAIGERELAARALANAAAAAAAGGLPARAVDLGAGALAELPAVGESHAKASILITLAVASQEAAAAADPGARAVLLGRAHAALSEALAMAERLGDRRSQAQALGALGRLYESQGRLDEALGLSRQAVFITQGTQSPDLYRWQWQSARVLAAAGRNDEAEAAYRRAVESLERVRQDVAIGHGNARGRPSFRESVGPLYLGLVDVLLQAAARESDPGRTQERLREARNVAEQLKAAELTDYFEDECLDVGRGKEAGIEGLEAGTAVVYLIPLPNRTEILLSAQERLARFTSPVGAGELVERIRDFRRHLENRLTRRYLRPAQELHRWLVAPIEPALRAASVDTLVFVPDGALRTIPMAALHDGERFLVEKYAVAVTPGLKLMDPKRLARGKVGLITNGLSEAVQGFPALPNVPFELEEIRNLGGGKELLDGQFRSPALEREIEERPFGIVHVASHGVFSSDSRRTFLLTYDDKLTLDGLERLIRPCQFRGQPVELLALSACQTAAGDDRAALGLAGVALKAGARSALATLWFVNDRASSLLVTEFYAALLGDATLSKAKALQRAQLSILNDERYSHPCYWAPFLVIGNWL